MADFISSEFLNLRIRWRFDFLNNKTMRCGYWSRAGDAHGGHAWSVDKTHLLRACIEVEDKRTWKVYAAAECDGHNFVNFEWVAGTRAPLNPVRPVALEPQIVGMKLVTRDNVATVLMDGSPVVVRARTSDEKAMNLAGFGR